MRAVAALRIAAAAAALAAGGCDFWNNLIDEKTLTRGNLQVRVLDAWTGEALRDADCRDSIRDLALSPDGTGGFRLEAGPTGPYSIRCAHEWYHEGAIDIGLPGAGASLTLRLARRGGTDWYADSEKKVSLPKPGDKIRFPLDLEWVAAPADDSGRFLYEWSFLRNPQMDRGHRLPHVPLPKEAYSPRFRAAVSSDNGFRPGMDTVILNVYSLLHDTKEPEYIGSDTLAVEWVQNLKPMVRFDTASLKPGRFKVGCLQPKKPITLSDSDFDGQCRTLRLWSVNSPSLPGYDTLLSCEPRKHLIHLPLVEPRGIPGFPGLDGAEEYDNTLIAEIVDDNGESARDTVRFRTFRNVPPTATIQYPRGLKLAYLVGDSVEFKIDAHDTDGTFSAMYVPLFGVQSRQNLAVNYDSDIPHENYAKYEGYIRFPSADSVQFWATVVDNCDETFETPRKGVLVSESRPPQIGIKSRKSGSAVGDSIITVTLDLAISDPDAGPYGDRIAAVRIDWDEESTDTVSAHAHPFAWSIAHKLEMPDTVSTDSIRIRAWDEHGALKDTTYLIRLP